MKSMDDAWAWYSRNRRLLLLVGRLGAKYWDQLPWEGAMGRDDHFRLLEGQGVFEDAEAVLAEFDDIAVFVMFSVFEAIVRDHVVQDVGAEVSTLQHPALKRSSKSMMRNLEEGSFYNNVLDLYKRDGKEPGSLVVNSLVEEVNRVRHYRNWVAHGRRTVKPEFAPAPKDAFDSLNEFLAHIGYHMSE